MTGLAAGGQTPAPHPGGLLLQIHPDPGGAPVEVHEVDHAGGFIWIATESGLFRYRGGQERPAPVEGGPKPAYTVEAVGDQVWAGGRDGLYRVDALPGHRLLEAPEVRVIEFEEDGTLIGTKEEHFFLPLGHQAPLRKEDLIAIPGDLGAPRIARRLLDHWWLGTERGAYRLVEGFQATSVEAQPIGHVLAIEPWGNRVCFVSAQEGPQSQLRCSTPEGVTKQPLPDPGLAVTAFGVLRRRKAGRLVEEPLVGTVGDLRRIEGRGQHRTVPDFAELLSTSRSEVVNYLFPRDDQPVVVTDRRVYRRQDEAWSAVPEGAEEPLGLTRGADLGAEGVWIWGRRGAYRLEDEGRLTAKLQGELQKGRLVVPPERAVLRFDDVGYVDAAGRPLEVHQPASYFKAVVVDRQMDLREPSPDWTPVRQVNHPLDRRGVVYFEIRDGLGNRTVGEQRYRVEGTSHWVEKLLRSARWILLTVVAVALLLLLAARFRLARLVLAQIAEREGWTRNLVEILLRFPGLSAQLLSHYKASLRTKLGPGVASTDEFERRRQKVQEQLQELKASPNEPRIELVEPDAETELDQAFLEVLVARRKSTLLEVLQAQRKAALLPIFIELPEETNQQPLAELVPTLRRSATDGLEELGDLQKEALARLVLSSRPFVLVLRADQAAVNAIERAWSTNRVGDSLLYIKALQSGATELGEETAPAAGRSPGSGGGATGRSRGRKRRRA